MGCQYRRVEYVSYGMSSLNAFALCRISRKCLGFRTDYWRLPLRSPVWYEVWQRRRPHCTDYRTSRTLSEVVVSVGEMVARNLQPERRVAKHPPSPTLGST